MINPRSLSLDSFLLNHSVEYTVAAISSWMEFIVEKLLVPGLFSCSAFITDGRQRSYPKLRQSGGKIKPKINVKGPTHPNHPFLCMWAIKHVF